MFDGIMNPPTDVNEESKKEDNIKRLDSSKISNDSTTPGVTAPNKLRL